MVTIRKPKRPVLFESLVEIKLDNPEVEIYEKVNPFDEAREALNQLTIDKLEIRELINQRECNFCYCCDNYLKQTSAEQIARLFLPQTHTNFPKLGC